MRFNRLPFLLLLAITSACSPLIHRRETIRMSSPTPPESLTLLSLGDSYTIGESVAPADRWPVQLARLLREQGYSVAEPRIIAQTGWTTGDLAAAIQEGELEPPYDIVTLLIGVNNQYRGYSLEDYQREFANLLEQAIAFAGGDSGRVFVLSIPDWSVTPFAFGRDRAAIAAAIDAFNAINRELADSRGVHYVDVTPISRQAIEDEALLAPDGLHPSAKMYAEWARLALPDVLQALRSR